MFFVCLFFNYLQIRGTDVMMLMTQSISSIKLMKLIFRAGVGIVECGGRTEWAMPLKCHQILPLTRSVFQAVAHPVGTDNPFPASLYPESTCMTTFMHEIYSQRC